MAPQLVKSSCRARHHKEGRRRSVRAQRPQYRCREQVASVALDCMSCPPVQGCKRAPCKQLQYTGDGSLDSMPFKLNPVLPSTRAATTSAYTQRITPSVHEALWDSEAALLSSAAHSPTSLLLQCGASSFERCRQPRPLSRRFIEDANNKNSRSQASGARLPLDRIKTEHHRGRGRKISPGGIWQYRMI